MADHAALLLRLFWQPADAMGAILDRGSLLFASLSVVLATLAVQYATPVPLVASIGFYAPLLVLAIFYVPGTLVLSKLLAGTGGSLGAVFSRDYSSLLTSTAMAFSAAAFVLALAGWFAPPIAWPFLGGAACLYFLALMFFAVRTVFGTSNATALAVVALSWLPLIAAVVLWMPLRMLMGWLASPFFLFYAYYYLGGEIGNLGAGLRSRQHYRRMLEVATVNPHDGEAQYQLGLIAQQRHRYTEAVDRFKKAIAIDPRETDAHFQLGRIAREQGRLHDALAYFQTVVDQDPKHSQGEILKELGAVYLAARQYEDARRELSEYVDRRPYDPEGLYYYGQSLEGLRRTAEAREMYARSTEAARTAPRYRRPVVARWSRLAQKQLRKLA